MRIWDIAPEHLCRQHLLGEHRELHGLWSVLTNNKNGYRNHPETRRWEGRLIALYQRHEMLVAEMTTRGYKHNSPLNKKRATGSIIQKEFIDTITEQKEILRHKPCNCFA